MPTDEERKKFGDSLDDLTLKALNEMMLSSYRPWKKAMIEMRLPPQNPPAVLSGAGLAGILHPLVLVTLIGSDRGRADIRQPEKNFQNSSFFKISLIFVLYNG